MACLAPFSDSKVRVIRSSRAWVSTWMVTSSGIWPPSISSRTKSKSVCEAEGKPTSISLRPTCTSVLKKRIFFAASIGSISDWLPSRRSELSQIGAWVMAFDGQVRSGMSMAGKARYLFDGFLSMVMAFPQVKLELSKLSARCGHRFMVQSYCLVRVHCNTSRKIGDLFRLLCLVSVLFLLQGKTSRSIARSACGLLSQRSRRGGRAIIRSTPQDRFGRLRTWR